MTDGNQAFSIRGGKFEWVDLDDSPRGEWKEYPITYNSSDECTVEINFFDSKINKFVVERYLPSGITTRSEYEPDSLQARMIASAPIGRKLND